MALSGTDTARSQAQHALVGVVQSLKGPAFYCPVAERLWTSLTECLRTLDLPSEKRETKDHVAPPLSHIFFHPLRFCYVPANACQVLHIRWWRREARCLSIFRGLSAQ